MLKEWRALLKENPSFGPVLLVLVVAIIWFFPGHPPICGYSQAYQGYKCVPSNLVLWAYLAIDNHAGLVEAFATVAVARFTWTLKNASIRQGNQTDRALEISERELTIGEWPFLYVTEAAFTTIISQPPSAVPLFTCKINVHGKSPAIVRAYRSGLIFSRALPTVPEKQVGWRFMDGTFKPGSFFEGFANWGDCEAPGKIETPVYRQEGKRYYAIVGVIYDDLFGHMHEVGFCYRGELGGGIGARVGGSRFNYHRLRQDHEREAIDQLLGGAYH